MHTRRGDWMQTYTGKQFWPMDPRPEEVCIEDIAQSLSQQCRFAGHCNSFYSVAEHSIRVCDLLSDQGHPPSFQLWGLLHDASEAYLVDVPRPIKRHLGGYISIEERVMSAILARFNVHALTVSESFLLKEADNALLATEARDIMGPPPAQWEALPPPLAVRIRTMPAEYAKRLFLKRFAELTEAIG